MDIFRPRRQSSSSIQWVKGQSEYDDISWNGLRDVEEVKRVKRRKCQEEEIYTRIE